VTELLKPVYRVTVGALDGSFGPDRGRRLVAGFAPGDLIEIRPQGTRRTERVSLLDVYRYAVRCRIGSLERKAMAIQKRDGGRLATARKKAEAELI
jgi:hypothetical protein